MLPARHNVMSLMWSALMQDEVTLGLWPISRTQPFSIHTLLMLSLPHGWWGKGKNNAGSVISLMSLLEPCPPPRADCGRYGDFTPSNSAPTILSVCLIIPQRWSPSNQCIMRDLILFFRPLLNLRWYLHSLSTFTFSEFFYASITS